MTFRSDFVADPVAFMQTNVVTPQFFDARDGHPGPPGESRPIVITLKPWANKTCSKRGGGCYHLSRDTAGLGMAEKLPIYWLAYQQNGFTQGMLSNSSQYMFTALMNGCSLGFGSQAGDGACLVSHANSSSSGVRGRGAQRDDQETQLRNVFGANAFNVVEPDTYQATTHGDYNKQATNFGKNVGGTWTFFSHTWMAAASSRGSGVVLHCGIAPAVSVPR